MAIAPDDLEVGKWYVVTAHGKKGPEAAPYDSAYGYGLPAPSSPQYTSQLELDIMQGGLPFFLLAMNLPFLVALTKDGARIVFKIKDVLITTADDMFVKATLGPEILCRATNLLQHIKTHESNTIPKIEADGKETVITITHCHVCTSKLELFVVQGGFFGARCNHCSLSYIFK